MSGVYLVDMGVACSLGRGMGKTWPRLCQGQCAIGPVRRFCTDQLQYHNAACLSELDNGRHRNRICDLMRCALKQLRPLPCDTHVIWAGVKGNVEYLQAQATRTPLPAIYLPSQYRQWICEELGIANCGIAINAACASSAVALAVGWQMIVREECSSVLICAADIVSRFTFTGFASLRGMSPTTSRPFDVNRDGLTLGDGAAAILLVSPVAVLEHRYAPLARLTGWGMANDANHITGPARDGSGLAAAVGAALQRAHLEPDCLEAWCMHGTGTVYNDAMELTVLEDLFGRRRFPIFSVKGAIGHTLGAAGALETAICVKALQEQEVPATASLQTPEERAEGRASSAAQPFAGNNILTTSSGFGGVNAALILQIPHDELRRDASKGRS